MSCVSLPYNARRSERETHEERERRVNPAWRDETTEAAILNDISLDEPWNLIEQFSTLVRLSGSRDEAKAVTLITDRLTEWGIDYEVHHPTCLISLPGPATLRTLGDEGRTYTVKTPSFSPDTGGQEVEAELLYVPGRQASSGLDLFAEQRTAQGQDLRGKIVMTEGLGIAARGFDLGESGAVAAIFINPGERIHEGITKQEALQLAAKEAVVVYAKAAENQPISRRLVYGPTLFVPAPGEWLHTFAWHGADGGSHGARKVAKGLVFQKLWLMPDQMYHDVGDVRTADDAVLTIKLMMFFELLDIDRMLEATHDPIGDFVNAATSDVVDFLGRRTFEAFKLETGKLNELETYRQLTARAAQNGYRINKVVYRGYDAPARLQAMHDQAIEARTKLQLERATEQQAQDLEDFKLTAQMNRATRRRTEQAIEVDTEIEMARKRQEAERAQKEAERSAAREGRRRDAEAELEVRRQADERQRAHLERLKEMGVDLTAFLTQSRADRVIELRGGKGLSPHLHLDETNGDGS